MSIDLNHDGRDDILWRNNDGVLAGWLADSSGGFDVGPSFGQVSTSWQVVGIGDFNGDGYGDILWRHDDGVVTNWLGTAGGGFVDNGAVATNIVSINWYVNGIGDFNGDGRDDILWRHGNGMMTNWLGTANGGFVDNGAAAANQLTHQWYVSGIGDFNGDGRDDLFWRHQNGTVTSWLGTASGGFQDNGAAAAGFVPPQWGAVETGDFNGDGRDDILWRHNEGIVTNWLGAANGGFIDNGAAAAAIIPTDWYSADVGDFNGDGRDDVMWRRFDATVENWFGTANGGFLENDAAEYPYASWDWTEMPNWVGWWW